MSTTHLQDISVFPMNSHTQIAMTELDTMYISTARGGFAAIFGDMLQGHVVISLESNDIFLSRV